MLLKRAMHSANTFDNIIGNSSPMLQVFEMVETIAPTGSTVLITGESGTGKELVARAIHVRSPRSERPFVAVNCGALTETLLDSELFGHMRGSFTGADGNRKGLIEIADKGTIFLDEIGEMSPMLQVKILRVLQERKFRRVGGNEEVEADIRIIAATNRDLAKMVAEGQFREDLFYRINVIPMRLPSLRERIEDVPLHRGTLRRQVRRADEEADHGHLPRRDGAPPGAFVARQRPRAGKRDGAGRGARADAVDPARKPAGCPAGGAPGVPPRTAGPAGAGRRRPRCPRRASTSNSTSSTSNANTSPRRCGARTGSRSRPPSSSGMSFRSFRYYMKKYNLK